MKADALTLNNIMLILFRFPYQQCPGECKDGAVYYKYESFREATSFDVALDKTPFNCVLAPVESFADLLEITSVIPTSAFGSFKANAWVGIGKSAADVIADNNLSVTKKREGWFNLDGSEVPVDSALWALAEPNNAENYQTRAYLDGGDSKKLGDMNPQGFRFNGGSAQVQAAVYKCCYDLCPEAPLTSAYSYPLPHPQM